MRCREVYSAPSKTLNVPSDPRLMNRATPYPCIGPHDNARNTSTSSVPCSRSSELAVMPRLYHQHLRESRGKVSGPWSLVPGETAVAPFPPETRDQGPETYNPFYKTIAINAVEAYGFPASKSFQFIIALNPIAYVPCDCQRQKG